MTEIAFPGMNVEVMARGLLMEESQKMRDDLSPIDKNIDEK